MNQEHYIKFHQEMCDRARQISLAKNNDYSAPGVRKDDPFAVFNNFMQAERLNICSVEQGFMVRISDKISRLSNLIAPGHNQAVKDESVTDTALDTINYLLLLLGYLETKRKREVDHATHRDLTAGLTFGPAPANPLTGYARATEPYEGFTCPECGSPFWGTRDATGPQPTGHCHGYKDGKACGFWWNRSIPGEDEKYGVMGVVRVEEQVAADVAPPPEVDPHFSEWFARWLYKEKAWCIVNKRMPTEYNPFGGFFFYLVEFAQSADYVGIPDKKDWVETKDPRKDRVALGGTVYYPREALKRFEHEAQSAYVAEKKKELL